MAIYERSTVIEAPLSDVWEFHSTVDGLLAVTPDWMGLRVERVIGPAGEPDPEILEVGTEIELSVSPFGVAPRQSWRSRIVDRSREGDGAVFRDVMVDGPFERWEHTHRFRGLDSSTQLVDRVAYRLGRPFGGISGLVRPVFEGMFRKRHALTKAQLE